MARHQISAAKPKPEKPKAAIGPAPSSYETTHPAGSAERFLAQAARDALAAAAAWLLSAAGSFCSKEASLRWAGVSVRAGAALAAAL